MEKDRDTTDGTPTTPPTTQREDDSWRSRVTDCWPRLTPERVAEHKRLMTPLDAPEHPDAARQPDEPDTATEAIPPGAATQHAEPDTDPSRRDAGTREVADEDPTPIAPHDAHDDDLDSPAHDDARSAGEADDPPAPARFAGTLASLDDLPDRPVGEHAELFDAVHRDLQQALDDVD